MRDPAESDQVSFEQFRPGAHIHLLGICGTAMASLAGLLKEMGFKISGSDQNVYPPMSTQLEALGIQIMHGYHAKNLEPRPDLVVVGNVISAHFEEAVALVNSGIPYTSLPKALAAFAIGQDSLVVAGTHGKTTTTSLVAWIAEQCGLNPGFLVGGIPMNFQKSFRPSKSSWFVVEGDEYDTAFFDKGPKFLHYKPKYLILNGIEFDHADIYRDLDHVKSSFRKLFEILPEDGILVYPEQDQNVRELLPFAKCRTKKSFGFEEGDYAAVEVLNFSGRCHFAVAHRGQKIADLAIKQFGPHNRYNALASFAMATELGWPRTKVLQALASFQGVKRRQELIGQQRGAFVFEDFAHHPTAVKLTLEGFREQFLGQRLIAVFEPRSATSRRKVFQQAYAEAFQKADLVYIAKPFDQSKIAESDRFSSTELVASLNSLHTRAADFENNGELIDLLKAEIKRDDVLVLMSNGGFGGLYPQLLNALAGS